MDACCLVLIWVRVQSAEHAIIRRFWICDLIKWASSSQAKAINLKCLVNFTLSSSAFVPVTNWMFEICAVLACTIWQEDLSSSTVWHHASHTISRDSGVFGAWDYISFEGDESVTLVCNILTSSLIWSLDMSWWALVALSIFSQVLVKMALLLRAIESSSKSEWWAHLTLSRRKQLLSWGAMMRCAVEWIGRHS